MTDVAFLMTDVAVLDHGSGETGATLLRNRVSALAGT